MDTMKKGIASHRTCWVAALLVVLCVTISCESARGILPSWVKSPRYLAAPYTCNLPSGIDINSSSYVYFCDTINHTIQIFSPTGQHITNLGINGFDDGEFNGPSGIAFNSTGAVYVADTGNARVQVFSPSGQFLFNWNKTTGGTGTGNGEFDQPQGIAINSTGYVYVADTGNDRVQVFSPSGQFLFKWGRNGGDGTGGSANGEFSSPTAITIDGNNQVYVVDTLNNRVQIFSPTGQYQSQLTGSGLLTNPRGIDINSTGYAFVTSYSNDYIVVYSPDHTFCFSWQLDLTSGPWGIAINASQHVFICEYLRRSVMIYAIEYPKSSGAGIPPEVIAIIVIVCVGAAAGIGIFWYLKKKAERKGNSQKKETPKESLDFG